MQWHIQRFPILSSTNGLALDWMASGHVDAGSVLVTREQTSGRGRQGRKWHSPPGALLMTAVMPFDPGRVGWTSLAAGIAVASAVRDLGAPAGVKWPNDVVLEGRKLGGILVETNDPKLCAVGIGLNVSNPLPPDEALLAPAARLIDTLPGIEVESVLQAVLTRLAAAWEVLESGDLDPLRSAWEALDTTAGRRVRWSQGDVAAVAEGVDAEGALLLRLEDGTQAAARLGEIRFVQ